MAAGSAAKLSTLTTTQKVGCLLWSFVGSLRCGKSMAYVPRHVHNQALSYHLYRHTQSAFAFNFRLRTATAQQASQHAGESHRAQKRSMGAETIHGHASVPRASASRPPKAGSVPRTVRSRPRHPHATQAASKPTHAALPQPACCPSIGARRTQKRLATGAGSLPSVALTQARDASHRHFKKNLQSAWLLLILCCSMQ